tara:strand:- start:416 stop:1276 length:861 start_codon:yes stop_codon:yes gene_type:complete
MKVIDFRARPNIPQYAAYLRPRLREIAKQAGGFGCYEAPDETVGEFVAELTGAGIEIAVVAARSRLAQDGSWELTNDLVAECVSAHRRHLVPFGGIDLTDIPFAVAESERCVDHLGFRGLCIDPFQVGITADHERLAPIYELCEEQGVAVVVTLGGMPGIHQPLKCGDPIALDEVAQSHPDLVLIGSHSGWPFTNTMIAVSWRRPNVFFENSFYHFAPGAATLVQAANEMIGNKMLYASAYPFCPITETLENFQSLAIAPKVMADVLYNNAHAILVRIGVLQTETE